MLGIRGNFVKVLKKILLIDHEPRVTRTVRRALESAGKYSTAKNTMPHLLFTLRVGFGPI
jgi:hypothetical protein